MDRHRPRFNITMFCLLDAAQINHCIPGIVYTVDCTDIDSLCIPGTVQLYCTLNWLCVAQAISHGLSHNFSMLSR